MKHPKVPEWKLERYVLGELPESDMQMISSELKSDSSLKERYDAIIASDEEIRATLPELNFEAQQVTVQEPSRLELMKERIKEFFYVPSLRGVAAFGMLMLVVGAVVMMQNKDNPFDPINTDNQGIREKGSGAKIMVFRKEGTDTILLDSGASATEGDLLQIKYLPKKQKFGFIFSVDGNNTITRHFPIDGDMAGALNQSQGEFLSNSYQLDNAPHYEKFYFITSQKNFSLSEIERSTELMIRKGVDILRLDSSFDQYLFTLKKE